jgi:hypothetical protein
VPPLPAWLRPWPYVTGGLLVGFLFLAEFALNTVPAVQAALLLLAIAGLAGVIRRWRSLELWPLFVAGAIVVPLIVDSHVVGLPRCGAVPPGVACLAGTRDVSGLATELTTLAWSLAGAVLLIVRELHSLAHRARDN